jgi:replicative DNA helicase
MDEYVTTADQTAETGVLSGIMFARTMPPAALCLSPSDFTMPEYRAAFEALRTAHNDGKRPEYIIVEKAIGQNAARAIEQKAAAARLAPAHLPEYINAVLDSSMRRKVIARCRTVAALAMDKNVNQMDILSAMSTADLGVSTSREPRSIGDLYEQVRAEIQRPFEGGTDDILKCGIYAIDNAIGGFARGNVTTICAHPGSGKSAVVMNILLAAAKTYGSIGLYSSLEDNEKAQAMRIMASEFGTLFAAIRGRTMSKDEIDATFNRRIDLPIYIEDKPYQSPESIRAMAIAFKERHGRIDFLAADHLMEMADESDPTRSTARNVKLIREIAKEVNCHILLVNQPKKNCDRDVPLSISDMLESGRTEQISRCVLLLFRAKSMPNIIKVDVAKNTNGTIGGFDLNFDGSRMQVW